MISTSTNTCKIEGSLQIWSLVTQNERKASFSSLAWL